MRFQWFIVAILGVTAVAGCAGADPTEPGSGAPAESAGAELDEGASALRECASDADCELVQDYCTGCDCRAVRQGETLPACDGNGVQCFVDPCISRTAACSGGECVVK